MTRTVLLLIALVPAAAGAQDIAVPAVPENAAAPLVARLATGASSPAPWWIIGSDSVIFAQQAFAQQPAAALQQQPTAAAPPRRRGSTVGYIADALVVSQLRVRFDVAKDNTAPDRAEFFYAKCGCYASLPSSSAAFDPNAPGPAPGIVWDLNFEQLHFDAEYAVHPRISLFGQIPVRWIQPQVVSDGTFGDQSGLGDISAGVKVALVSNDSSTVTARFRTAGPSGSASKGLGVDHWSIEPALLYSQALGDRVTLESQIGDVHPTSGSAGIPTSGSDKFSGDVFFYGVGPSVEVYRGPSVSFAPVFELVGWHVLGGFQTLTGGTAEGINIVNMKIGARTTFRDHSSLYVGYGKALTDAVWYDDIVRIEYRFLF